MDNTFTHTYTHTVFIHTLRLQITCYTHIQSHPHTVTYPSPVALSCM